MVTNAEKTRENRSRREAKRRGLELVKALPRDSCWLLVDPTKDKIVSGLALMTIEEIEDFLEQ